MKFNNDPEWIRRKAEAEDGCDISVGGSMSLVWNDSSISECPGCGGTVVVGIMSLCATCPYDGYYYVDLLVFHGWYSSQAAFERGDQQLPGV